MGEGPVPFFRKANFSIVQAFAKVIPFRNEQMTEQGFFFPFQNENRIKAFFILLYACTPFL